MWQKVIIFIAHVCELLDGERRKGKRVHYKQPDEQNKKQKCACDRSENYWWRVIINLNESLRRQQNEQTNDMRQQRYNDNEDE